MDEEFHIPDNVIQDYRLFGMGPRHLKRLAWSPLVAFAMAIVLHKLHVTLWLAIVLGLVATVAYAVGWSLPLGTDDNALLDDYLEIYRHLKRQNHFPKERSVPHAAAQVATPGPPTAGAGVAAAAEPGAYHNPAHR